jgi:transcriptional regulator with XRE-family HTH domain
MSPDTLLRDARQGAGLTQAELAERLGLTQAAIARLERPGANPTLRTLQRALHATGNQLELRSSPRKSSVDETLVASNLRMTPANRLRAFQSAHASVARLREQAGTVDGDGTS